MKIRSGFVSNSSSSSFIVRFPKDPTDINTLREMMGDCAPDCGYTWLPSVSSEEVINAVHKEILEETCGFDGYYERNRWDTYHYESMYNAHPTMKLAYDGREWDELEEQESDALVKMWLWQEYQAKRETNTEGEFIFEFEFSDENGSFWSQMEHGNVFRNLNHTVTSHH